jgi:predicted metallopeptidase
VDHQKVQAMVDITDILHRLLSDAVRNTRELRHVDPRRVLVCFSQARSRTSSGVLARVAGTRFPGGKGQWRSQRHLWRMPSIRHQGREVLYVMYFYLPRFLNLDLKSKLGVLFHELYHIGPRFDGDLRRYESARYLHGNPSDGFDEAVKRMTERYWRLHRKDALLRPLALNASQLRRRFGRIEGMSMPTPKPYLVPPSPEPTRAFVRISPR